MVAQKGTTCRMIDKKHVSTLACFMKILRALFAFFMLAALPILMVVAWGSVFDSEGGEPFSTTVFFLIFSVPMAFLFGAFFLRTYLARSAFKLAVILLNFGLLLFNIVAVIKNRHDNREKQIRHQKEAVQSLSSETMWNKSAIPAAKSNH